MKRYFKGWYFKVEDGRRTAAFIPAIHADEAGTKTASIQIICENSTFCVPFSYDEFSSSQDFLRVRIGENVFSGKGMYLNMKAPGSTVCGSLRFGPLSPVCYDIMGPFRYVPLLECRHSIFSMTHTVNGTLTINNEKYTFDNGTGYIEGDRGRSFPSSYLWTQCNFEDAGPGSISLSVAEIPLGALHFTGIIGVVLWHGREYRIATYLGASVTVLKDGAVTVRQGKYSFTAKLLKRQERLLYAPVQGNMRRRIRESASCTAAYRFEENGEPLIDFSTDRASFEYEYDR